MTAETLAKINSYASFDGLTPRAGATKLRIAAWNTAWLLKEKTIHMRAYLTQEDADVACLSETKIDRDELQKLENLWPYCATKKGYSGTTIFSKTKPLSVKDKIVMPNAGQKLERLAGFVDTFRQLPPEEQLVSYFLYRFNTRAKNKGWRLDYFVVSQALLSKV
uniref:Endonuclease/exonuclease/phosphatase domain-containing protein n=1 Tax=Globisporangium ultimum (strain ATCC 200006 / CBS 805.95 / DAOM BR144) TaxID=431595 RepID=K3WXN5_GLOUD